MNEMLPRCRIDAHHHLWRYTEEEFNWLAGELKPLQRDFLMEDLATAMRDASVTSVVSVQARQILAETDWLLETAATTLKIAGVVGWLPVASETFPELLEHYSSVSKLCGVRHVVQAEPAGFLDCTEFNRGIRALAGKGLVYDILIHQEQLSEAIRFVDRHPEQPFVLDHLAKPLIRTGDMEPWATSLRELARRPNVVCKLSGMVTEAGTGWTPEQLEPYFQVALEAFTPARLMVGSDWPVLTAHCAYAEWWSLVERWIQPFSETERIAILGGTAIHTYGLALPSAG